VSSLRLPADPDCTLAHSQLHTLVCSHPHSFSPVCTHFCLCSLSFVPICTHSCPPARPHLHPPALVCAHLHSFVPIYSHLHPPALVCIHLYCFGIHLHSFTQGMFNFLSFFLSFALVPAHLCSFAQIALIASRLLVCVHLCLFASISACLCPSLFICAHLCSFAPIFTFLRRPCL